MIAERNQGDLPMPPTPVLRPKAICNCRRKRRFPKKGLSRLRITQKNPSELPGCNHFVAISYCWKSQEEAQPRYSVETENGVRNNNAPSDILQRSIAFAAYHGIRLIWIDQECIVQSDREDKEEGIQSMDLVYQQATHAEALLNVRITSEAHGSTFVKAMTGQELETHELLIAIEVFEMIAADRWLTRAWCFQETAAAGELMRVLIPCDVNLPDDEDFMTVPGELEMTVSGLQYGVAFIATSVETIVEESEQSSECSNDDLRLRTERLFSHLMEICPVSYQLGPRNPYFRFGCNAAEALHLLKDRINSRVEDRLAILANLCNYRTRLNTHSLHDSEKYLLDKHSLSVCFAVLAILNGDMSLIVGSKR